MATITNTIRWADNTADLKKNLLEGIGTIDAMKASVDRTVQSLSGNGLFQSANKVTAAIIEMGGATKLTASEQDRANGLIDKAIEKYKLMGMTAPPAMIALRDAMKGASQESSGFLGYLDSLGNSFVARVAEGMLLRDVIREFIDFGKQAFTNAAAFEDLSLATGLSTDAIQKFGYVGEAFGLDTQTMARGVEQLSSKLANGDANATKAVQMLGLSVKGLLAEGPEEAFLDTAEAVGRIEDPMMKAGVATDLFGGKLAKILLPALGDLRKKIDEVPKDAIISQEDIENAHALEVGVSHLITKLEAYAIRIITLPGRIGFGGSTADTQASLMASLPVGTQTFLSGGASDVDLPSSGKTSSAAISNVDLIANRLNALRTQSIAPLTAAQQANIDSLHQWGIAEKDIADLVGSNEIRVKLYIKAQQDAAASLKAFQRAEENLMPILTNPMWDGSVQSMLKLGGTVHDTAVYFGTAEGVIRKVEDAVKAVADVTKVEASPALAQFTGHLEELGTKVPQKAFDDIYNSLGKIQDIEHGTTRGFDELPKAAKPAMEDLAMAFTPAQKAVVLFSQSIQSLPSIIMSGLSGGNVISSLSGLGANLTKGLFGGTGQDAGPLAGITKGLQGAVSGALSGLGSTASSLIGKFAGSFLPAIGGLIGPAITAIMNIGGPSAAELAGRKTEAAFEASFGGFNQMMASVGAAYAATGRSAAQAQVDVKALIEAEKQGGDAAKAAIDKINSAFNEQKQDAADLQTAIDKYGFTIDQLGPAMQKQKLGDQAEGLMNDFRLLAGSGIDVNTVLDKMSGSVNDFLNMAIKTGFEVPAAMRPMLEKMAAAGELTDANGNKITDLTAAGVTYAETMSDAADRIVKGFNDILVKIGLIPAAAADAAHAIASIPSPPDIGSGGGGQPEFASTGGVVTNHGIQYFGSGGHVLSFAPRGTDTVPAMLTPGEMVLNRRQQQAVFGGSGGGSITELHIHVDVDGKQIGEAVTKYQTRDLQTRRRLRAA